MKIVIYADPNDTASADLVGWAITELAMLQQRNVRLESGAPPVLADQRASTVVLPRGPAIEIIVKEGEPS